MESFTLEELYIAYEDCIKNKKSSRDYLEYELKHKKTDLIRLLEEINTKTYKLGNSYSFIAYKPKIREIFAAGFRDRIVHHLLVGKLENYFEKRFINNVFSCRKGKGALLGIKTLFKNLGKVDDNNYYLQLDLKGFFMNIDKEILFSLVNKHITKKNFQNYKLLRYLIKEIIFNNPVVGVEKRGKMSLYKLVPKSKSLFGRPKNKGLPIGNLTSQFFANIYLNELDNYIKRELKTKYYYRYVDDFILLGTFDELIVKLEKIEIFLEDKLRLRLSETKTKFLPVNYDIDFIGYIIRAKKIMLPRKRNINSMKEVLYQEKMNNKDTFNHTLSSINSYLGILKQAKTYSLRKKYLTKLNSIIFKQNNGYLKVTRNDTIYSILDSNKKPLKKYREAQVQYKNFVIIVQVGCFYKVFDKQAIYFSEKLGLKLTIFNPKTKGERIMCGFHQNGLDKYIGLIKDNKINSVLLKQTKDTIGIIDREIFKIFDFKNNFKIPIYSNNKINEIKINYYKKYLAKQENKKTTDKVINLNTKDLLDINKNFILNFKETDFSKKTYYELIEYIIHRKKFLI
ncbi:MAG: reverse transcriptase domain-containing protein [Candidatus Gracilibacteria bacterium]